jgi:hypothetical protein
VDVRVIGCEGVGWIRLVDDKDQWRDFVEMVITFRFCKKRGIS